MSRGLSAALQQREGEVLIRLTPPSLGTVRIQLGVDHGTVNVRLETSNPAAQQMLDGQLPALRQALESRGLHVERVSVHHAPSLGGAQGTNNGQQSAQQGGEQGSQQNLQDDGDAGGAPSRGRRDAPGEHGPEQGPDRDHEATRGFEHHVDLQLETVA